jgi:hypothetical protein
MAAVMARELAIDVGYDPGLRGAGKIVSRNDLIAESRESTCLVVAQDIPRGASTIVTANDRNRAAEH